MKDDAYDRAADGAPDEFDDAPGGLGAGLDGQIDEFDGPDGEVLAALAGSLRPVEPSPQLRERVLGLVALDAAEAGEARTAGAADAGAARGDAPDAGADADARTDAGAGTDTEAGSGVVVPLRRRRRRWAAGLLRAAAVVVVLGVGIAVGRWSAMDSMEPTEHYAHLNQAQDVRRVTDTMPDGHIATLTWSEDMSMTALSLPSEMMEDTGGDSLQVWLRKGGTVSSLGLYDPASGTGFTFLDLMPEDDEQIFITREPAGGSDRPTGEALVTFDVNADGTTTRQTPTAGTTGSTTTT